MRYGSSTTDHGVYFVDPEEGDLACGAEGKGRLADVERILARANAVLGEAR